MRRMLPAPPAEFLQLQAVRSRFPVLGSRIVPLFAITALQRNDLSGHSAPSFFLCGAGALAREKLCGGSLPLDRRGRSSLQLYCTISLMVPAPTVCPPSRMAQRKPLSMATDGIKSITQYTGFPVIHH